jgi:P-type Cu+ transporter
MNLSLEKPIRNGLLATIGMLALYFLAVGLISDWPFVKSQFALYWYFIISLAIGFGIQIALYTQLKQLVASGLGSGRVLGVTGATSTAAMISCCAHYLTNILPILGTIGLVTFIAQYQTEFFWIGLAFNIAGITYMISKIKKVKAV